MKTSLITLALMAGLAACSGAAETTSQDETAASQTAQSPALFADLGGENSGPIHTENKGDTLAVSGYDVVSYFTGDGVPVEGAEQFTVRYEGFDYRFASEENAQAFIEDPAKYAPAYGGYCAWAIGANNALAPGDPDVYEIVDGTLYLNFNEDVQARWEEDIPGFIESGNANYPTHSPDEHFKG
ncbi:YHS domain-containing protein [Erythrobacter sp. SCSIO 43205]|uniref:YHS domain-containing (seleno)protein n=1 Tax=Erythrobacter sp. SCSIO 43205 TaxID=2779361 RepID=UPI001CA81ECD|nr:YHS domain-containing (seleno)protein [Erythrobacter sp. SCSIO 43205]UAB77054.1 YHS domain-containing protein [Erythrobacter sp. SCSIO 43205]